jgi:hypothetical protein
VGDDMTPGIFIAKQQRKRHKLSNVPVDTTSDWSVKITDEEMLAFTDDQQAALNELQEQGVVFIPSRFAGNTEADRRRNKIFKTLVYKDLCGVSMNGSHQWVYFDTNFMSRM